MAIDSRFNGNSSGQIIVTNTSYSTNNTMYDAKPQEVYIEGNLNVRGRDLLKVISDLEARVQDLEQAYMEHVLLGKKEG